MPQTEAEHLENQSLDYDENEKPQSDAEVSQLLLLGWNPLRIPCTVNDDKIGTNIDDGNATEPEFADDAVAAGSVSKGEVIPCDKWKTKFVKMRQETNQQINPMIPS